MKIMKIIRTLIFLLLLSCNNKNSDNHEFFKIQNYEVIRDEINNKGERKIELKNKISSFKIIIDSLKNKSVMLTFLNEEDVLTMKNVFKNDSLYFYPFIENKFELVGKGKVNLIIDSIDIFYKGWIKSLDENELNYFDGNVSSSYGVNVTQYIKYNKEGIIENESYYYKIIELNEDRIKFKFSTIQEDNKDIRYSKSYLTLIDNSSGFFKRIDSLPILSGINVLEKSFLKNNYNPYLETNNYYKDGKIETIVLIPFDTITIPIPSMVEN